MAIEDYRDYKKKQTNNRPSSQGGRPTPPGGRPSGVRTGGGSRHSAPSNNGNRPRPTGTVVKKKKKVNRYVLTEEGKKFFKNLALWTGIGAIGVAGVVGLVDNIIDSQADIDDNKDATAIYGEDTREQTAEDVLNNILGGSENGSSNDTYVANYAGESYNFCSEEYALELAQNAIDKVNALFSGAGMKPLVPGSDTYLNFDKYTLAGLAFTESSFRYSEADGDPLYSSVKARGMCQCKAETLDYVKWYVKTVLGEELDYEFEDLDDPRVSMEVAAMVLATNVENYFKPTRKNNAFAQSGLEFSPELQKSMMLASYNAGAQGVVNRLLETGATSSEYARTIIQYENAFREKYSGLER
ncbi:MAG: hypothetical protein E7354_02830 [Clostridiales bacterium]|nr:hypothetical protein [Clostridiales bacterium]